MRETARGQDAETGLRRLDIEGEETAGFHHARDPFEKRGEIAEIDHEVGGGDEIELFACLIQEIAGLGLDEIVIEAARCGLLQHPSRKIDAGEAPRHRAQERRAKPGAAAEIEHVGEAPAALGEQSVQLFRHMIAERIDELGFKRLGEAVEIGDEIIVALRG